MSVDISVIYKKPTSYHGYNATFEDDSIFCQANKVLAFPHLKWELPMNLFALSEL